MNKITDFQKDLQNGSTINEALTDYDLDFHDVFKILQFPNSKKNKSKKRFNPFYKKISDFIYQSNTGKYYIYRYNNHKRVYYYGSFNNKNDAEKIVEYFQANAWDKRKLDFACEKLGIKRNK